MSKNQSSTYSGLSGGFLDGDLWFGALLTPLLLLRHSIFS